MFLEEVEVAEVAVEKMAKHEMDGRMMVDGDAAAC